MNWIPDMVVKWTESATTHDVTDGADNKERRYTKTSVVENAEIAGLDIDGLDNDGRMCGQVTELKLQNVINCRLRAAAFRL